MFQSSCLRWLPESVTKPALAIFMLACLVASLCSQAQAQDQSIEVSGDLKLKSGTRDGLLTVTAEVPKGFHTYSLTQPAGGPTPTTLKLNGTGLQLAGDFVAKQEPEKQDIEFVGPVEEYRGSISWQAPVRVSPDVDPADLKVTVDMFAQICNDETQQCQRPTTFNGGIVYSGERANLKLPKMTVEEEPSIAKPPKELELAHYQPAKTHVTLTGSVFTKDGSKNFKPGDTVTLEITAVPLEAYHFYAYATKPQDGYTPTMISIKRPKGWKITGPEASEEPTTLHDLPIHEKSTTWTFKIKIPKAAAPDQAIAITGGVLVQTCIETCDRPSNSRFTVTIPMGTDSAAALAFDTAPYGSVATAVKNGDYAEPLHVAGTQVANTDETADEPHSEVIEADTPEEIAAMARMYDVNAPIKYINFSEMEKYPIGSGGSSSGGGDETSLPIALLFAFVGGAILNLMPCVFPVLGIKVMGFVNKGGEKPAKIRMHGFAFAAGLVFSMWILAGGLLLLKNVGGYEIIWGEQMANPTFVGGIIVLLFVLGLNMAGVFEIGTSMSSVGGNLSNKEGYSGSFFSGVLTTLIATPCSGPFLGTAMTYAFGQPAPIAMLMFTVFGLGIASPYVLLTLFPPLIKRLPKPGAWMEVFKVTMAFALFATVAFFMKTFGSQTGVDGIFYMLMGLVVIGLAAYFFGVWGEPHIASGKRFAFGYAMPLLIAGAGLWSIYSGTQQASAAVPTHAGTIPWVKWHPGKVIEQVNQKKIVWADYTADW